MANKVRIRDLDAETQDLLTKLFTGNPDGFARFGEVGYIMACKYKEHADSLKNMAVRPDDVWVTTYPRSGTTWTQDLVWLLMNNFDYDTALRIPLIDRYYPLEITSFCTVESIKSAVPGIFKESTKHKPSFEEICNAPSPRFIKSHLPLSLLPDNLLDTTKVVYVARDPRDVAVSYYHFSRLFKLYSYVGDFKTYWKLFVDDLVKYTPFIPHLKEAWAKRDHPNMLFIFYEDLKKDLAGSVQRIATFLGKKVTPEQTQKLCEHLDIKNFRNNESVNPSWFNANGNPGEQGFIREGKTGGWRDYFDEEMAAQAQHWLRTQLADTDLRFPQFH